MPFRAFHDKNRNSIDNWIGAAAGDANQARLFAAKIAMTSRAGKLGKDGCVKG